MKISGNSFGWSLQMWLSATAAEVLKFSLIYYGPAKNICNKKLTDSEVANLSPAELLYAVIFSRVLQE